MKVVLSMRRHSASFEVELQGFYQPRHVSSAREMFVHCMTRHGVT